MRPYLIISKSLHNLGDVEQNGILKIEDWEGNITIRAQLINTDAL